MLTALQALRALRTELLAQCSTAEQRALVERAITAACEHVLAAVLATRRAS